ncbi:hypothetical protein Lfu02_14810 [Longispora fulva]|uniref:Transporter n=1 Tax=Longispora fulva TaxID=619741 RepID=A0A8J7KMH9_9ACTN|nr:2-keto-3-deoxygluconate permease [Longispora fulva]MBG6140509.1 hypothetical protein [Longispora fulva]GIG57109.1 hypothetical protein Lfu02_14810 [Longispora fulva]
MIAVSRLGRIPGLIILVPLLAGAVLSAACDRHALGPITSALTQAATPCIAVLLIAVGAQISVRELAGLTGRSALVLAGTTILPAAMILAYGWTFGDSGIAGVPLLTLLAVGLSNSYAMWAAIARKYGGPDDVAAGCLAAALSSGPLIPLLVIAAWRGSAGAVSWRLLLDSVLPLLVGLVAGNVAPAIRAPLRGLLAPLLPVLSFGLGWSIPLSALVRQAPAGIVLAVAFGAISGGIVALSWGKLLHRPSAIGWAAGACAANSGALPQLVASADPRWAALVPVAAAQASVAVLASSVFATIAATLAARRRHIPAPDSPAALDVGADRRVGVR